MSVAIFKQAAEACRYALVSTRTDDSSGRSGGRAFLPGLLLQTGSGQLLSSGFHFRRGLAFFIEKIEKQRGKPRIEISLDSVLSSKSSQEIGRMFNVQSAKEIKWQPLIVTAKISQIESCTVGIEVAYKGKREKMHLVWPYPGVRIDPNGVTIMSVQSSMSLNPDDPVQLIVWRALKTEDALEKKEQFYLSTDSTVGLPLGPELEPIEMSITFYSKDGQVNKKPYWFIFHAGSWDKLSLETIKNQGSSRLRSALSFLSNRRSRSLPSIIAFRPIWRMRVRRTV